MSGTNYFLDTNAIIALLNGSGSFEDKLLQATWVGISVVSVIEFLSLPGLPDKDRMAFEVFSSRVIIAGIPNNFAYVESVAIFKAANRLKLPDALIAYAAIENGAILISNDKQFQNLTTLPILRF